MRGEEEEKVAQAATFTSQSDFDALTDRLLMYMTGEQQGDTTTADGAAAQEDVLSKDLSDWTAKDVTVILSTRQVEVCILAQKPLGCVT